MPRLYKRKQAQIKSCAYCNKEIKRPRSNRKYCGNECKYYAYLDRVKKIGKEVIGGKG